MNDQSGGFQRPITPPYLIGRVANPTSRKLLLLIATMQRGDLGYITAWPDAEWQRRAADSDRFCALASAVELLAQYADEPHGTGDLTAAREAWMLAKEDAVMCQAFDLAYYLRDCQHVIEQVTGVSIAHVRWMCRSGEIAHPARPERNNRNLSLIYELFGNPFRPVTFAPDWRTDTAVSLARTMYEAREFSAMPILADALQDAGCDSDDILNHCRDPQQVHVRGCWVVDLVLGKG
jgi:hypothetical protein